MTVLLEYIDDSVQFSTNAQNYAGIMGGSLHAYGHVYTAATKPK